MNYPFPPPCGGMPELKENLKKKPDHEKYLFPSEKK
jgi:hypothetical protein